MSGDGETHYPRFLKDVKYSNETSLQTLDVCLPRPIHRSELPTFWVIYIHGGAWRDPTISSKSFDPALFFLLDHPVADTIAGFASINYRLSPYPSHQNLPSLPDDAARNAQHPDHIQDVIAALAFLQNEYGFKDRYLLVGHSCGATLAFQVTMARWQSRNAAQFSMPQGVLGLEGIYDLGALRDTHKNIPMYQEIIENAFGSENVWADVSPTSGSFLKSWTNGKLAVLAQSVNDELVDQEQLDRMAVVLEVNQSPDREDLKLALEGKHDDVWRNGWELAQSVATALQHLLIAESNRHN